VTDELLKQDLADLHDRWIRAIARGEWDKAHEAFEAIDDYCNARELPVFPGGEGVLVRITKEGRL